MIINSSNTFMFNSLPVNAGIRHTPKVLFTYLPTMLCKNKLILSSFFISNKLTLCKHTSLHNEVPMYYKCKDRVFL